MLALRAIESKDDTTTATPDPRPVRPGYLKWGGEEILACRLTNVPVTITSPRVGTVLVIMRAFYQYRDLSKNRGDIQSDEKRSEIICDLQSAFSLASRIRCREEEDGWRLDANGNTILIARGEEIMFIVDRRRSLLLAVYDKKAVDDALDHH